VLPGVVSILRRREIDEMPVASVRSIVSGHHRAGATLRRRRGFLLRRLHMPAGRPQQPCNRSTWDTPQNSQSVAEPRGG
jgi:hypothetical protein